MEKATGCCSLSVNIHQKKRVTFFLDAESWEGGFLKLQSLPYQEGAAACCGQLALLWSAMYSCLPILSSLEPAPSSPLQTCYLAFAAALSGPETAAGPPEVPCEPPSLGDPFLERASHLPAWGSGQVTQGCAKGIWGFKPSQVGYLVFLCSPQPFAWARQ